MKLRHLAIISLAATGILPAQNSDDDHIESIAGEQRQADSTAQNDGTDEGCGNPSPTYPGECLICDKDTGIWHWVPDTSKQACEGSSNANALYAYTGNAQRIITDLTVAGSPGSNALAFTRYSATRLSNRNLSHSAFGRESAWSHNYEWVLRETGTNLVTITYPYGHEVTFSPPTGGGNVWEPDQSYIMDRIVVSGTDYILDSGWNSSTFTFKQRTDTSNGIFHRLESLADAHGNTTTITYNSPQDNLMRRITDASGRWIELHYNDMGTATQVGDVLHTTTFSNSQTGQWHEVTITPSSTYRFLAFYQGNTWRQKTAVKVAELEFYDENNTLITGGTPYGSTPLAWPTSTPDKAFDGDTATHYRYRYEKGAYVGIDLGVGTASQVSKIRFFIKSGINNDGSLTFVGQNVASTPNHVISHVTCSDGRQVGYSYDTFTDPSGFFQWARLRNATYPDGTDAAYTYTQRHPYTMPLLKTADDPRFGSPLRNVRYDFKPDTVIGFVKNEDNRATGEKVVSTYWGTSGHKPKLGFSNGRVKQMEYNNFGRMTSLVDSYGFITAHSYYKGHLTSTTDALGRKTRFHRGPRGELTKLTTPEGGVTQYTRDSENRPLTTTRNGDTTTHTRDARGLVTRTDHPDGTHQTWTYNTYGQPLTHRLRNGHSESWAYDATGLKTSHTDAVGSITSHHYYGSISYPADPAKSNLAGRLAAMVDPYGNTTAVTEYNDRGQAIESVRTPGGNHSIGADPVQNTTADFTLTTHNTYNDYGDLLARSINTTDPDATGQLWTYTYDSLGRKLTETDPLDRTTTWSFDHTGGGCGGCGTSSSPASVTHPDGTLTAYTYDKEWRLLTTTRASGTVLAATTSYTYDGAGQRRSMTDPLGHVTRWDYDADGRVISVTRAHGTPLATTTTSTYDLDGNTLTSTDAIGTITAMTYDSMNRAVTTTLASGTAIAATNSRTYNTTTGELDEVTDPLGRATFFDYDTLGRNIKTTLPDGNFAETYYDALGRSYKTRDTLGNFPVRTYNSRGQAVSSTNAAGVTVTTLYDGLGRAVTMTYPSGKIVDREYDVLGNPIKTILAKGTAEETAVSEILTRDDMLRPLTVKDGEAQVTTIAYDILGRTTSRTDSNNHTTAYTYDLDGQLLTTKAPDNVITSTRAYDALHRLLTNTDGASRTISYAYDAAGRMISYTDAKNATFSFGYDALGRRTSRTEPDNTSQAYTYDIIGRLTTHTKADGKIKTHHYLNASRNELTKITYSNGEPDQTYTYNTAGLNTSAANQHATVSYGYDAAGRRASETQAITGLAGSHAFSYTYNMDGQLASHTRPDGSLVEYGYNARQLLASLTSDGPPPVADYTYNGRGQLTGTSVENGIFTRSRGYDAGGRLTSISQHTGATVHDVTSYTLDVVGQRTAITRNGGTAETYGYDAARQVTGSTINSQASSYAYDLAGNRSASTDVPSGTLAYTANTVNEYTLIGSNQPTHDLNGNQTYNGSGSSYTWDINNRLTAVSKLNGDSGSYGYDPLGRRVKRTATIGATTTTTYYLTNGWNVELEHDGTDYTKRRSWGLDLSGSLQGAGGVGGLIMTEILDSTGNVTANYYPAYDGNGNITALLDNSATVVATWSYDAYGNTLATTGDPTLEDYRFSTKPYDELTGLYYYGYRYYDPTTGRWPSRDPIGERGGANLYAFVGNDGVNRWDLWGLYDPDDPDSPSGPWSPNTQTQCRNYAHLDTSNLNIEDWEIIRVNKDIPISEAIEELGDHFGLKILEVSIWYHVKGSVKIECRKRCRCRDLNTGQIISDSTTVLFTQTIDLDEKGSFRMPVAVSPTWTLKILKTIITGVTIKSYVEDALDIKKIGDKVCDSVFE